MLMTYEAKYQNGRVLFIDKPKKMKNAEILVTILSPLKEKTSKPDTNQRMKALSQLQKLLCSVSPSDSLSDELICERRKEAKVE